MNAVTLLGHGLVEESPLTPADRAREALLMGLRLAAGIDPLLFEHRTGVALDRLIAGAARARLAAHGLIDGGQPRRQTTTAGRLVLDALIAELAGRPEARRLGRAGGK